MKNHVYSHELLLTIDALVLNRRVAMQYVYHASFLMLYDYHLYLGMIQ